jgi:hypothetical protein
MIQGASSIAIFASRGRGRFPPPSSRSGWPTASVVPRPRATSASRSKCSSRLPAPQRHTDALARAVTLASHPIWAPCWKRGESRLPRRCRTGEHINVGHGATATNIGVPLEERRDIAGAEAAFRSAQRRGDKVEVSNLAA